MPNFSYKVRDKAGKIQSGMLEAENTRALAEKLRTMGFFVTSIKEEKTVAAAAPGAKSADIFDVFKKPKARDLVVFSHQLATMIGAGLTLTASLGVLAEQVENKQLQAVVVELRRDVEEGNSFSSALEKHPKVFIPIFINMVRAGEASGNLEAILNRIAVFAEEAEE
ncbi:MAG: type II secretion system F family protein, partial [Candidatus Omnitrophica bacterium]|nr:type II secretion system F family protein [Candidatus Omnitrophota bacterium]